MESPKNPSWQDLEKELETIHTMMIHLGEKNIDDSQLAQRILDIEEHLYYEVLSALDPGRVAECEFINPRSIEIVATDVQSLRATAQALLAECPQSSQKLLFEDFQLAPQRDEIYELRGWLVLDVPRPAPGPLAHINCRIPPGTRIIRTAGLQDAIGYWLTLQFDSGMRISIHKDHFPSDGIGVEKIDM